VQGLLPLGENSIAVSKYVIIIVIIVIIIINGLFRPVRINGVWRMRCVEEV
jgi:hypothetical protein